ncbi:MAG: AAA family ATPase [Succinivibrionaceae bacterium]|nr:AAA family ATPase [Succinivibrionaceae bacterium]
MYIHRILESKVRHLAEHFPVVMVCGARQVGKTTLLKKIAEESKSIQYVTLDFPRNRQLAKADPELFLQKYAAPLIIDEIQHAPELLTYIKIRVDEKGENGMYYLAGSQMFHMMRNVGETLAGRMAVLSMYSLSGAEMEGRESRPFNPAEIERFDSEDTVTGVFDRILRGGMPRLINDADISSEEYYGSYMQTYIERDIRDLISIRDESKFVKFPCPRS